MVVVSPPAALPRGNLESYTFPTEAEVDRDAEWAMTVHNNGGASGVIWAGINNRSGNPGAIVITRGGVEYTVEPGYVLIIPLSTSVCMRLEASGLVRFATEGSYIIRLIGGHKEDTQWYMDTYADVDG